MFSGSVARHSPEVSVLHKQRSPPGTVKLEGTNVVIYQHLLFTGAPKILDKSI